jgi:hypothetical protein
MPEEVAREVGIDRGTLYRYFDRTQQPGIARIPPLCKTLNGEPTELLKALGYGTRREVIRWAVLTNPYQTQPGIGMVETQAIVYPALQFRGYLAEGGVHAKV